MTHDAIRRAVPITYLLTLSSTVLLQKLTGSQLLKKFPAFNPLTPKDPYFRRTAPQTSKRFILYIYSTNTGTEYFKRGIYSPFLSLQNAVCFIILTYLVPVLFTFYLQSVLNVAFYIFIQQI